MQIIFHHDKIQDISLTLDNVLNILMYGSPFCVIMYMRYTLSARSSATAEREYSRSKSSIVSRSECSKKWKFQGPTGTFAPGSKSLQCITLWHVHTFQKYDVWSTTKALMSKCFRSYNYRLITTVHAATWKLTTYCCIGSRSTVTACCHSF